ncbi:hypothetical protein LX73_0687 [Fodinibius salinus]|uniref:Anti sigma-E protein RseA, N-terminal domain n=1 Tax=Fodinibius salinus TaxID=860790 RepID=A0A5D3YMP6_9BACT|nr:hypothetical protein [Fodinibius salinus]TYP95386.1 hypothetical protein LX73_0687 [Fodinibius salinus]
MQQSDNDCIRYLMKEMDPSEELLMERAMMSDEDLLIEVESMRQTLQKLDKLPQVEPPSDVTDSIMEKAAEQAEKNRRSSQYNPVLKYAVAATVALTITAGGMWLYVGAETEVQSRSEVSSANTAVSQTSSNLAAASMEESSDVSAQNKTVSAESDVSPWVDRNDILRFQEQVSGSNANFQAIIKNATQKLKPVKNPPGGTNRVNNLQLTGSGN